MHHSIIDAPANVDLSEYDPDDTGDITKKDAEARLPEIGARLQVLQDTLYAAHQKSVLIILQGIDSAGKDGTIKHVMTNVNPTGCVVSSFKEPTPEELGHDFLWRVHQRTPQKGMIAIFNRSHYEDVLVARVHKLVPESVWKERYDQINHFEHLLAQNDTLIFKFFLHISKDEQTKRLTAREDDPDKAWKLSLGDWREHRLWSEYQDAYHDAIGKCGTAWAPWHIVPANKKWYRNYFIASTLVDALEHHQHQWLTDVQQRGIQELAAIQADRQLHPEDYDHIGGAEKKKTRTSAKK